MEYFFRSKYKFFYYFVSKPLTKLQMQPKQNFREKYFDKLFKTSRVSIRAMNQNFILKILRVSIFYEASKTRFYENFKTRLLKTKKLKYAAYYTLQNYIQMTTLDQIS
jgi:hypothetical protein